MNHAIKFFRSLLTPSAASPLKARSLFSAGIQFWFFHLSSMFALLLVHIVVIGLIGPQELLLANLVGQAVWAMCFLVACLALRRRYIVNAWKNQNIGQVLAKGVLVSTLLSAILVAIFCVLFLPFFVEELLAFKRAETPNYSAFKFISVFYFANLFQSLFYLIAWLGLYIGITNSRRAKAAEVDNLRLQNSLKEARLSSLSNQLNPHFLFNALNNIRFMILENGKQAEAMVMSLSEVLRYSLESSKQDKLPLEKEVAIIQRYLELVKSQFEDRLQFKLEIEPELNDKLVPPMILQMLIENAVKHGVEQLQNGGVIDVRCIESGGRLILRVCNDTPNEKHTNPSDTGIGLKNIEQRLRLLYATNASIKVGMIEQQFCVSVDLPLE